LGIAVDPDLLLDDLKENLVALWRNAIGEEMRVGYIPYNALCRKRLFGEDLHIVYVVVDLI
jgi:hypothetical protein